MLKSSRKYFYIKTQMKDVWISGCLHFNTDNMSIKFWCWRKTTASKSLVSSVIRFFFFKSTTAMQTSILTLLGPSVLTSLHRGINMRSSNNAQEAETMHSQWKSSPRLSVDDLTAYYVFTLRMIWVHLKHETSPTLLVGSHAWSPTEHKRQEKKWTYKSKKIKISCLRSRKQKCLISVSIINLPASETPQSDHHLWPQQTGICVFW